MQILPESKCHLWHIPCLSQPGPNGFGIVLLVQRIKPKFFWQKWNSRGKCLKKVFFYNCVQQPFFQPKKTTHIPKKLLFFQKGTILNVVQMRFFFKTSHFSCEDLLLKKQNMLIAINCVRQRELWIGNKAESPNNENPTLNIQWKMCASRISRIYF